MQNQHRCVGWSVVAACIDVKQRMREEMWQLLKTWQCCGIMPALLWQLCARCTASSFASSKSGSKPFNNRNSCWVLLSNQIRQSNCGVEAVSSWIFVTLWMPRGPIWVALHDATGPVCKQNRNFPNCTLATWTTINAHSIAARCAFARNLLWARRSAAWHCDKRRVKC